MRFGAVLSSLCVWLVVAAGAAMAERPGGPGPTPAELSSPIRLSRANNGNLLVSDYQLKQILVLGRRNLDLVRAFEVPGRPLAVAVGGGRVYVGNASTHRVEVYNRSGERLFDLGGAQGMFQQPTDIAVDDGRGLVFVVDGQAGLVKVFDVSTDETGLLIRTIPPSGPDPSLLASPTGIALDADLQEVLVSDFGAAESSIYPRVQVFDYTGNLLTSISGRSGMMGYRFSRPQGLAVHGGHIFVVASWLGRVIVFDRTTGAEVASLGTYGTDPGELALPLDVVVDRNSGNVYVTNNRSGRIEVFVDGGVLP